MFHQIIALVLTPLLVLAGEKERYKESRLRMIEQMIERGIEDRRVIHAMEAVERHLFVPENLRVLAYADQALPIGEGQTISQPHVVALMTEAVAVADSDKVLEIGTGSGCQAAVLAALVDTVYTIEIKNKLAEQARERLKQLEYKNIRTKCARSVRCHHYHLCGEPCSYTLARPAQTWWVHGASTWQSAVFPDTHPHHQEKTQT
jgi:protein-L-isoaspartate(D-aspartate) O-methyltransferase